MRAVLVGVMIVAVIAVVFLGSPSLTGRILGQSFDIWVGHSGPFRSSAVVTQQPGEPPYSIQVSPIVVDPDVVGSGAFCFNAYFQHGMGHLQRTYCYSSIPVGEHQARLMRSSAVFVSDLFTRQSPFVSWRG